MLEHAKAIGLMFDVRAGDRMFWFTTTGWMMWNFLVGSMLVGGVPVLYDGSPGYPEPRRAVGAGGAGAGQPVRDERRVPRRLRRPASGRARRHDLSHLAVDRVDRVAARRRDVRLGLRRGQARRLARLDERRDRRRLARSSAAARCCRSTPGELQARALGAKVEAFDEAGRSVVGQTGELVLTAPLPSMPVGFWNDPDGARYRESYFEMYPGVWRHGDWIRITERGSAVIEGRSDSTLNRQGIRFGTSELYGVVESLPEVVDSLVIGLELPGGGYWMPLFVVLADGVELDDALDRPDQRTRSGRRSRSATSRTRSSRSRPIPRTLTGKKMEVPVKRLLSGPAAGGGRGHRRDRRPDGPRCVRRVRRGRGEAVRGELTPSDTGSTVAAKRRRARSARRSGVSCRRWTARTRQRLVVALDGPGSSGKSSVGAAAALQVGYRFCDTGLLYRAVTWLALARRVSASYPHAMRGLVDEVELAPDAEGRLARVLVDGVDHTDDVRRPGGRCRRLGRRRRSRSCGSRCSSGSASSPRPAGSSWPAATSGPSCCPMPTSRSSSRRRSRSGPAAGPRSAASTPTARRRSASSTALRRRDELDSTRAVAPLRAAAGRPDHLDRRQPLRGHRRRRRQRDPRRRGAPRRRDRTERRQRVTDRDDRRRDADRRARSRRSSRR